MLPRADWLRIQGALFVGGLLLAGCSFKQQYDAATHQQERAATLKAFGSAYMAYNQAHDGQGPKTWDELQQAGLDPKVRQDLEKLGYVLVLGVGIRDLYEVPGVGTLSFMIAYPANPTGDQVVVGVMEGASVLLTADEFKENLERQKPLMAKATVFNPPAAGSSSGSGPPPPPPPAK